MDFPGHFQHIFQQLNHQRLHAQLCDCVVVVGGQSFQAHRSILAASSSHFRALLSSSDGDEGGGGGGGAGAFSTLLDMIYTSTLSLGASNVMDVLLAASHLHLNTVVKACKLHLSKRNFPASPPKGWRSVQQPQEPLSSQVATTAPSGSQLQRSGLHQHLELSLVTSAMEEELNEGEMGMEVSQSGEELSSRIPAGCQARRQSASLPHPTFPGWKRKRRWRLRAVPGSEACSDPDPSSSSGSAGDSADRPALTRASEDVLSKCKKAAAEDHVLLVEGEKKYACKICCKTFMNLTDCKKHIRVHTGEKPYPCPKCGKRFSQSSHLYKHSKNTCLNWKGDNQPFPDTLI
uniref:Zinc finger and BTB domain containing 5 n=1 Tax=Myripristis murdjan TaxID=586833 RepID=A0A667WG32_9TELE